jgi:hypothetical protein
MPNIGRCTSCGLYFRVGEVAELPFLNPWQTSRRVPWQTSRHLYCSRCGAWYLIRFPRRDATKCLLFSHNGPVHINLTRKEANHVAFLKSKVPLDRIRKYRALNSRGIVLSIILSIPVILFFYIVDFFRVLFAFVLPPIHKSGLVLEREIAHNQCEEVLGYRTQKLNCGFCHSDASLEIEFPLPSKSPVPSSCPSCAQPTLWLFGVGDEISLWNGRKVDIRQMP